MTPPPRIDVQVQDPAYAVDAAHLVQAAQTTLTQQGQPQAALSIVIDSDAAVQALNVQFRGVDAPTDVLSFPADPLPEGLAEADDAPYVGDLVIAYPYASTQAARLGHPLKDSLALLVVHGTLHLLGHDHDTPARKAAMWQAQAQALRALGIDTTIVPALEGDNTAYDDA